MPQVDPTEPASLERPVLDYQRPRRRLPIPRLQEAGLLVVVAMMWIALSIYGYYNAKAGRPNTFLNPENLIEGIGKPMSVYAIMAVGMTCVIVAGGIDISVASILALSGLLTARLLEGFPADASWMIVGPLSLLLPLSIGLACGLINGSLVVGLRLHPFIVTLGTLSVFRCLANLLPFKNYPSPGNSIPGASVTHLFAHQVYGLQVWPMLAMLVVVGLGWFYLRQTVPGRENYAVGGNEEAARFSGIRVGAVKLRVFAISGLLAGLAGLVSLGRFGSMATNTSQGDELIVIAAAVVGGASLAGGRGTAIGALMGSLLLATINNAIDVLKLNQEYKMGIVGTAIIVAAALDRMSDILRRRGAAGASRGGR